MQPTTQQFQVKIPFSWWDIGRETLHTLGGIAAAVPWYLWVLIAAILLKELAKKKGWRFF